MKKEEKSSGGIVMLLTALLLAGAVFEAGLFAYVGLTLHLNKQVSEQMAAQQTIYQEQDSTASVQYIGPTVHVSNNRLIEGEWEPAPPVSGSVDRAWKYTPAPVPKIELADIELAPVTPGKELLSDIPISPYKDYQDTKQVTASIQKSEKSNAGGSSSNKYSNSGSWGESSTTNEITGDLNRTAYWVSGGKSYHFSKSCPSLARSKNIQEGTLQDDLNAGKTDPCNNCAGGS